jgi:pyridoxine 5-phosphate synthase
VVPGEVTSQAGWQLGSATDVLPGIITRLRTRKVRVSLFVDASPDPIRWAAASGADRVELYTEPFARAFEHGPDLGRRAFVTFAESARLAHSLRLGVNAGHDLDLANLTVFRELPFLDEVSIGHAYHLARSVCRSGDGGARVPRRASRCDMISLRLSAISHQRCAADS